MTTRIDPRSATYERNATAYAALIDRLRERMTWSLAGGGEKLRARHLDRGKVPVRERIDLLLDPGSAFSNCRRSRAGACTTTRCRRPGSSRGSATCPACRAW